MGSRKLVDRVLSFMGFEEVPEQAQHQGQDDRAPGERPVEAKKKATVVNLHAQRQMRVVVLDPKTFEEAQGIAEHLKNRRPVVVNLEHVETDVARRIVDFVSGATFALNGSQQKVGGGIFLFVPNNVEIEGEVKEPERGGIFPWMKS